MSSQDVQLDDGTIKVSHAAWESNGVAYVMMYNEYRIGLIERLGAERAFANSRNSVEEKQKGKL
jgi:hypothetical protein